jgi:hypothetical protein
VDLNGDKRISPRRNALLPGDESISKIAASENLDGVSEYEV